MPPPPTPVAHASITAKKTCCRDSPRCRRCPVVCKRLAAAGYLERTGRRTWRLRVPKVPKAVMRAMRRP